MSGIDDKRKERLIEKHRQINVNHEDWWDDVYSQFIEDMEAKGIDTSERRMSFSGFCSQGDGASFTGYIHCDKTFLDAHPQLKDKRPTTLRLVYDHHATLGLSIERTGHRYVHENTVSVDVEPDQFYQILDGTDPLRMAVIEQWDEDLNYELIGFREEVQEIIRDYCRELYNNLKEEFDYLTSDEAVWEAITANDLDALDEDEDEETDEYA